MSDLGKIFEYEDMESSGDNIQAHYRFEKDKFYIAIENPWAGDTETGFGEATSINLTKDAAKQLYDLMGEFLVDFREEG